VRDHDRRKLESELTQCVRACKPNPEMEQHGFPTCAGLRETETAMAERCPGQRRQAFRDQPLSLAPFCVADRSRACGRRQGRCFCRRPN
jgi:hypothetical protein